jgi:hypothetical protein
MSDALQLFFALLCCVIGFAWLALALEPHWRQVRSDEPLPKPMVPVLRALGSLALFASLVLCSLADHPSMMALVWPMALAVAALLVAFIFAWRPRTFAPLVAWIGR